MIRLSVQAPPEMSIQWDIRAIKGAHRWLNRVWALTHDHMAAVCNSSTQEGRKDTLSKQLLQAQNKAIKQVLLLFGLLKEVISIAEG